MQKFLMAALAATGWLWLQYLALSRLRLRRSAKQPTRSTLAQQFTTTVTLITAIIVTAGGTTAAGSAAGDGTATRSP
jgi:hypothetical protein